MTMEPTPEQLADWKQAAVNECRVVPAHPQFFALASERVARLAYPAGADAELEACCEWIAVNLPKMDGEQFPEIQLRAARRPKPPSLKQQALDVWRIEDRSLTPDENATIRRALESLPDD